MNRLISDEFTILSAKAATGIGVPFLAADFQHILVSVSTSNSANFTLKFKGSSADTVDFSAAQSPTNRWDYIQVKLYDTNAAIDGSTGVSSAGSDLCRIYELNINGLKWVTADVTAYAAGKIYVSAKGFSNQ